MCTTQFSVASGGLYDVKRHAKTAQHTEAVDSKNAYMSMNLFVSKKKDNIAIFSETVFANFVAEHNLAFSVADHHRSA